jgi:hypothetical protein
MRPIGIWVMIDHCIWGFENRFEKLFSKWFVGNRNDDTKYARDMKKWTPKTLKMMWGDGSWRRLVGVNLKLLSGNILILYIVHILKHNSLTNKEVLCGFFEMLAIEIVKNGRNRLGHFTRSSRVCVWVSSFVIHMSKQFGNHLILDIFARSYQYICTWMFAFHPDQSSSKLAPHFHSEILCFRIHISLSCFLSSSFSRSLSGQSNNIHINFMNMNRNMMMHIHGPKAEQY